MVEKKLIVDGIRFTYHGPFDITAFFRELDGWMDRNGFERETKKKLEHVELDHKKLEYIFELWKNVGGYARSVVRLHAIFDRVVDFEMERKGHTRMLQRGQVLVVIDGFLETDIEHRWMQKPWWVLVKSMVDRFVWHYWWNRWDSQVSTPSYDLYDVLLKFFRRH